MVQVKADVSCGAEYDKAKFDSYAAQSQTCSVPRYRAVLEESENGMAKVVFKRSLRCGSGDSVPRTSSEGLVKQDKSRCGSKIAARLKEDPADSESLARLSAQSLADPTRDVRGSSGALWAEGCLRSPVCPIQLTLQRGKLMVQAPPGVKDLSYLGRMADFERKPRPSCRTASS